MSKQYKIFIVDDDKFLLEMYRKKFEKNGCQVELALGSQEALDKLRGGLRPDVLILDIIMPGMDGMELLETIRKENLASHGVIIMLSNEGNSAKIERAKVLGVAGYIVKATSIPSEVVEETLKIADAHLKSSNG